jgi:Zn-ribbon-containing, possibly nucleic-acid-binding protein (DUF2310)
MDTDFRKVDRPIPAKVILTLKDESYSGEVFISLSTGMYHQRLIYGEPRELRKNTDKLELTVTFLDRKSFETWLENQFIKKYHGKDFNEFLTDKPQTIEETDVIIEVDSVLNCSCNEANFYFLKGRTYQFIGELVCGNCLRSFPYSRIPLSIKIEEWQTLYERVYANWMDSGIFEGSALRQLTNYTKGILNKEGEKIRKELTVFFGKPVYMEYFITEPDENKTCVICDDKGTKSGLRRPQRICKKCNTAFDYSE